MPLNFTVDAKKNSYAVYLSNAESTTEARNNENVFNGGGGAGIIAFIKFDEKGNKAIDAIRALMDVNEEEVNSIRETMERLLTKVFIAGIREGKKSKKRNK